MIELGSGAVAAAGIGPKAALLDRCAAAGLAVPAGVVLPAAQVLDPVRAAHELVARRVAGRLAIRSAFSAEDGASRALAGMFTSCLDVTGDDVAAVATALRTVVDSAATAALDPALRDEIRTDVLVLAMVPAVRAGVAFTERDHEDDLVDHTRGLADRLVAGEDAGARERLPKRHRGERHLPGWRGRLQRLLREVRQALASDDLDIEWADDGVRCWLVQVRPITAAPWRDEALTLANHREILPDLPSAFTTAIVADAAPELFGYWRRFEPSLPAARHFVDVVAGRPVINLSLLTDTMRILGLPTRFVTDSMGGQAALAVGLDPRRIVRRSPALVRLGLDQLRAVGNGRRAMRRLAALTAPPSAGLRDDLIRFRRVYVELITGMFALTTAISGPLAVLEQLGVAGVLHTRQRTAGTQVWDDLAPLRRLAADPDRRADLEAAMISRSHPSDPALQTALAQVLEAHGHRGIYESDVARPRYREDPTPLLEAALYGRAVPDPPALPVRAIAVWPLWVQAARAIRAREELRSEAMRHFETMRQRFLAHGAEAVDAGRLPAREDLFLLDLAALHDLADGARFTATDLDARRATRDHLATLRLPDLLWRSDDPEDYHPRAATPAAAGRSLRGLGLSAGTVTGTCWVVDEPTPVPAELRGSPIVLVTRGVDAGWVSTFSQVEAVVVETGGELSHGSIVLRETGTPAVTNVAGATSTLATGDRVRVRAASGRVEILAAAGSG